MMTNHNTEWSLAGEYLEACNCDAGCPCKFGADPTQGHCDGIIGFEIKEGHYGSVELDGLRFALLLHAPESPFKGNLRTACYLDERAGPEQREAMDNILSGKAGGFWELIGTLVSDNRGVKLAQIDMDTTGERRTFAIPGILELTNEPLVNPITGVRQEVTVSNTFDPFCASGRAGKSVKALCTDPDFKYDLTGRQGYTGPFEWTGP